MTDADCVRFLQWALPRLRLRWAGYRRVRRQVCKRLARRLQQLGLDSLDAYADLLEIHREEWRRLDALCRVSISRFGRDRGVFLSLAQRVLPVLAGTARKGAGPTLRCWSVGCASGEEPYTLSLLWCLELASRFPDVGLQVVATDANEHLLERAREATYPASSVRELPEDWRAEGFEPVVAGRIRGGFRVRRRFREAVEFRCGDVRGELPQGPFHLVLCRNLVFTYFEEALQREVLANLAPRLLPGGALVLGGHERLPAAAAGFVPWNGERSIWRRE